MTNFKRNVKVLNNDNVILFEGSTEETKLQLINKFGKDIKVLYSVLYTTVNDTQSYDEAINDPLQVNHWCYSLEEFKQWLVTLNKEDLQYVYIAYNENNLSKQKAPLKVKSISNNTNVSINFYTSFKDLKSNYTKDLTSEQINIIKEVLTVEDKYIKEYKLAHPDASNESIKSQQVESILVVRGPASFIDFYITKSNIRWINYRLDEDNNEVPIKGIIKNKQENGNNYITVLFILNVNDTRNNSVLKHVGWL
jgi:hypothetical protein